MTAKIQYEGQLRTSAVHLKSGNQMITDAPTDNHGKGAAFSPTDLVATALGSCILTIMGITAQNHQIEMVGATAEVSKTMTSHPRRIAKIELVITMPKKDYTDREKSILEKAAHHCPVGNSLHPNLEEIITFVW